MSRVHGQDVRSYLGSRDASGDIVSITPAVNSETHDVTTQSNTGWKSFDPGLKGFEVALEAFHDPAVGGISRQWETLLGELGAILSVYDGDADAIGDTGILFADGILTQRSQPITVADMIRLTGAILGSGPVGLFARLLHVLGAETVTGNAASVDNAASSANGGRGNLHVTAATGTWTIKIQHSTDNAVWADLITFTAATGATSQSVEVAGTVNRYLRATHTEDVAGTVTYVAGFARY